MREWWCDMCVCRNETGTDSFFVELGLYTVVVWFLLRLILRGRAEQVFVLTGGIFLHKENGAGQSSTAVQPSLL